MKDWLKRLFKGRHVHQWSFHCDKYSATRIHRQCLNCPHHEVSGDAGEGLWIAVTTPSICRFEI